MALVNPDTVNQEQAWVQDAGELAGVPDAFGRLWTPHRMAYIKGADKPATPATSDCPFCASPERDDQDGLIVARGVSGYVVMNLYPYAPGHLLVCPYRHIANYIDANADEVAEIASLTRIAVRALTLVSGPAGFNIGMNQGAVGGAGISAHLHQHVVPRWLGDTNFLPIVAQTRAVPQLLSDARALLAQAWGEASRLEEAALSIDQRLAPSTTADGPGLAAESDRKDRHA